MEIGDIIARDIYTKVEKKEEDGGREGGSRRAGSDGSNRFSNGIDPVQGHGGDEGLPAQIPPLSP